MPTIPTPPGGIDAQIAALRARPGVESIEDVTPRPAVGYSTTRPKKKAAKMPGKLVGPGFRAQVNYGPAEWVEFTIPLRLESVANWKASNGARFGHAGKHRKVVALALSRQLFLLDRFALAAQRGTPVVCTITRMGRPLDDDNLGSAAKFVRDTCALFLGVDDGPKGPVRWEYRQEVRAYDGVRVRLELGTLEVPTGEIPF